MIMPTSFDEMNRKHRFDRNHKRVNELINEINQILKNPLLSRSEKLLIIKNAKSQLKYSLSSCIV